MFYYFQENLYSRADVYSKKRFIFSEYQWNIQLYVRGSELSSTQHKEVNKQTSKQQAESSATLNKQ